MDELFCRRRENVIKYVATLFGIGFLAGTLVIGSSLWLFAYYLRKRNAKVTEYANPNRNAN